MTPTTTLDRNGTTLSRDYQIDGWYGFVNGGEYTDEQQGKLVDALMSAQEKEFDTLLPEDCFWSPRTSEITGPITATLDGLDIDDLMTQACETVIARFAAIEAEALGTEGK